MEPAQELPETRVIELDSPQRDPRSLSFLVALLFTLTFSFGLTFSAGYFIGKYTSPKEKVKNSKVRKPLSGFSVLSDKNKGYSLVYPSDWVVTKQTGKLPAITFTSEVNKLEFLFGVNQPYSLSDLAEVVSTKKDVYKISGEAGKMTEYSYKNGSYFAVFELDGDKDHPKVTFWAHAQSSVSYQKERSIIDSFLFD